jgi:DNA-binding transcriptional MerR regulator
MNRRVHRVSQLARLAGVTVRTLHHYDAIGLLAPSGRSASGHRLYTDVDLLRLQQILIGRALGLSLEQIRRMLDDPEFDYRATLERQRAELRNRADETAAMIRAVDAALATLSQRGDPTMNPEDLFEGFDPEEHREEAERRWGETDSYRESARRTSGYSPEDWASIKAEETDLMRALAERMRAGEPPEHQAALELAERHRLHIDRWFYPCSHAQHAGLAQMYVADDRFRAAFDRHADGLAAYLAAAIEANARRHG